MRRVEASLWRYWDTLCTNILMAPIYRYSVYECNQCGGQGTKSVHSIVEQRTMEFPCDICAGTGELVNRERMLGQRRK